MPVRPSVAGSVLRCTLIFVLVSVTHPSPDTTEPIAIVGLGVGGAAAAHYVRKFYPHIDIVGFEQHVIGGRAQEIVAGDKLLELGGSVIYGRNMYMLNLTLEMNLTIRKLGESTLGSKFTLYDGKDFVFKESGYSLWDKIRLLFRWGFSPLVYTSFVKNVFKQFYSIYGLQEQGKTFNNPAEIAAAMGLMELTQMSGDKVLQNVLGGKWWLPSSAVERFIDELPGTANRVNYNQHNEELNGFVNTVSFMPATDRDLWAVAEGNNALPRKLVAAAGVKVQLGQAVTSIHQQDGKFFLETESTDIAPGEEFGPFSSVILATPLELTNITFSNITLPDMPPRKYQTTVSTFIKGRLRADYFGYKDLPLLDLSVTNSAKAPFTAIAPLDLRPDGDAIYKMFSTEVLNDTVLSSLFDPYTVMTAYAWKAYPHYDPPQKFAPFVLSPGLFYNNAIESLASAMEMSMIAGVNSALLVKEHLQARQAHEATADEAIS